MNTHLPLFVLSQLWLELSVVTKGKKKRDCSHGKKVKIERRRTGRLIPYQIPNAQKGRKKRKEEEHGRLFAQKKIKKERK